ncbi:MAG: 6-bladed beta-propeller [Spirochaetales bacterium]|nr:6-bladed beta-propeller [Spirochaetales bacterium]
MKRIHNIGFINLFLLLLAFSCAPPDFHTTLENHIRLPDVVSASPSDQSLNIAPEAFITLTFNQSMDIDSVALNLHLLQNGDENLQVPCALTWSGNNSVLTMIPGEDLDQDQFYLVKLERSATSKEGIKFQEDFRLAFSTSREDIIPPEINRVIPYDNEQNVLGYRDVVVMFSEEMDVIATEAAFKLYDMEFNEVPGTLSWEGKNLFFSPEMDLMAFGDYYISISKYAYDLSGNCLIDSLITKFTVYGKIEYITQIGKSKCDLIDPRDIALYEKNGITYIFVLDNYSIFKFRYNPIPNQKGSMILIDKWGKEGSANGELDLPLGITIGDDGSIYIADTNNNRIQKFSFNGNYITQWGGYGSELGELRLPFDLEIGSDGSVFVCEFGNHRIQKFSSNGDYINHWGGQGAGTGEFYYPERIAIYNEKIFVIDGGNDRVQEFSLDGSYITQWGSYGTGDGQFYFPDAIAISNKGSIFIKDSGTNGIRIQQFDSNAMHLKTWDDNFLNDIYPKNFTIGQDNSIFIIDSINNYIVLFNENGEYINHWGSEILNDGRLRRPQSIAVGGEENAMYVADTNNNRIQKFSSEGSFIRMWGELGSGPGEFDSPEGIAVGKNGVYVVDWGNARVQQFDFDGQYIREWGSYGSEIGEFYQPHGIAVGENGSVYIADSGNYRIQKFSSTGTFIRMWGTEGSGAGEFNFPYDVESGENGMVYIADTDNHRIQKFTSDGVYISRWGRNGWQETEFNRPFGIATGISNMVFVADSWNTRIQVFNAKGQFLTQWGKPGSGNLEFYQPNEIEASRNGMVYVVDTNNERIQIFRIRNY